MAPSTKVRASIAKHAQMRQAELSRKQTPSATLRQAIPPVAQAGSRVTNVPSNQEPRKMNSNVHTLQPEQARDGATQVPVASKSASSKVVDMSKKPKFGEVIHGPPERMEELGARIQAAFRNKREEILKLCQK